MVIKMNYLYKASGGLGHFLKGLQLSYYKVKENNYNLIIDSKNHKGFENKFTDVFYFRNLKNYRDYNGQKFEIQYKGCGIKFKKYLLREFLKDLKLDKKLCEKIVKKQTIQYKKYISIHFRNTDKKNNIKYYIRVLKDLILKSGITTVYLASDDFSAYDKIKKELPNITLIRNTIPPKNIRNLHYSGRENLLDECLIDMYNILKSTYFIPSINSGLSCIIIDMILANENIFDVKSNTKFLGLKKYIMKTRFHR